MRTRIIRVAALVAATFFLIPLAAQAVRYAPGETLNPTCGPTDPTCGVTTTVGSISPGTAGQVPYYLTNGNALANTSAITILQNGNVGIGTTSPAGKLTVFDGANQLLLIKPSGTVIVGNDAFPESHTLSAIAYSPSTLTGAATSLTLGDDEMSSVITLPFTFKFYGTDYTSVYVCSNGYVSFTGDNCSSAVQTIPSPPTPAGFAGFWADLNPFAGGTIRYETLGTAPDRVFVVDFVNVPEFNRPLVTSTFQIKLFETSNSIELHAGSLNYEGTSLTEGIESPDGTMATAVAGRNNISPPFSLTNDAVQFAFTSAGSIDLGAGGLGVQNGAYFGGNVGIGTITPGYKLDVNGSINATSLHVNGVAVNTGSAQWSSGSGGSISYIGGNVGLGTASPAYQLDVIGVTRSNSSLLAPALVLSTQGAPSAGTLSLFNGFSGYVNVTGGIGTGGTDSILNAQRITSTGNLVNIGSIQGGGLSLSKGGTFIAKADYTTGLSPRKVLIGDLNGDGKADLVAPNGDEDTVSVFLNNGNGTFAAKVDYTVGSNPFAAAVGDLNGDGKMDIVTGNAGSNSISVLMNNGDGTFAAKVDYPAGFTTGAVIGDLNGDGMADIAVTRLFGPAAVSVYLNNGNGTFGSAVDYATGAGPFGVAIGDFNGDGKADLATANRDAPSVSVFLNNGNGTFGSATDYTTGAEPLSVAAGDLNGDGKADLVVANSSSGNVSVFLNNGNGTFAAKVDYTTDTAALAVAVGDLNGDGKADLVSTSIFGLASVLLNNGNGTFATGVDYGTGGFPGGVAIGDLNGDGKADVVSANQGPNSVSVLLNSPTPLFYASASTGNVGIGTTTPAQKLEVRGTIRQAGCITAGTLSANTAGDIICTPSSLRFKDNIQSIGAGLSEIVELRPVSYNFKPELDMGSSTRFGLIAEEVASVTPEFATYDASGAPYGLDTNAILAAAVNAIKELDLKVNGGVPTAIAESVSNVGQAANSLVSSGFDFVISQFNTVLGVVWENGVLKIANIITDTLTTREINATDICASDASGAKTCINKAKLDALLLGVSGAVVTPTASTTEPAAAPIVITTVSTTAPEATATPLLPNTGAEETPPPPSFERTLDIGTSGADVTALQILLMQKGYLFIPPQMTLGYFGELTRAAVIKYQAGVGLRPTGVVDLPTRTALNAELGR